MHSIKFTFALMIAFIFASQSDVLQDKTPCKNLARKIASKESNTLPVNDSEFHQPKHDYRARKPRHIIVRRPTRDEILEYGGAAIFFSCLIATYVYFWYDDWQRIMYGSDSYRNARWLQLSHIGI